MVYATFSTNPSIPPDSTAAAPVPQRWKRGGDVSLLFKHFGNNSVLFNPRSGSTHLVNDLIVDILDALAYEPADRLELSRRLQLDPNEGETMAELERILRNLDQLGLIMPVDM
ncbi:MAG: HPr-rel-A system PqqD family peptide chaperone [Magnetococcales bacterium]|nr:HPr-rel-A system PqqD family peptide chaperone [Magnetococcales bacterium]HIJ84462.1 HPr-rel-A system PqqD family peptide chaperone [Magnetococcales bacterium]